MGSRFLRYVLLGAACLLLSASASRVVAQCTDADADGFYGQSECGTAVDCNDANPSIFPGATESCDGLDHDCDGLIDNGAACGPRSYS